MKKNIKNQKGAISLFVLLSMMFFLAFMFGAFSLVSRRNAVQVEALKETKKIYSNDASARDKYDAIFASSTSSVVPITNFEQLKNVKATFDNDSTVKYLINGNVYTYTKGATYVLQNDIILDLEDTVDGKNGLQDKLYDYVLYNANYKVNLNGHSIYYEKDDGSIWKLVCYQNMGDSSNPNLFNSIKGDPNYYGKSYNATTFSILDDGISPYSNQWISDDNTVQNFEFMLMYNTESEKFDITNGMYNRWRQTNNPTKEIETVTGYTHNFTGGTAKLTSYTGTASTYMSSEIYGYWGGLAKSSASNSCYLDGAVGHMYYHYAVAVITGDWNGGKIPAALYYKNDASGNKQTYEIVATECLLFVRYK